MDRFYDERLERLRSLRSLRENLDSENANEQRDIIDGLYAETEHWMNESPDLRDNCRRFAVEFFKGATRFRLPIVCCELIVDGSFENRDLLQICLAALGGSSAADVD